MVTQRKSKGKGNFYTVDYDIILLFGMTELKAQVAWIVNVSGLHILFHPTDIGLNFFAWFLGKRETVSLKKEIVSY